VSEIKESRVVTVADKIVRLEDLYRLATVLSDEHASLKSRERVSLFLAADCDDGSKFSGESPTLYSEASPIATKRATAVHMELRNFSASRSIVVELSHSGYYHSMGNRISVAGMEPNWVNGVLARLEDVTRGMSPQSTFVAKYRRLITLVTALGIGAAIVWILVMLLIPIVPPTPTPAEDGLLLAFVMRYPLAGLLIRYGGYYVAGWGPSSFLVARLAELWPSVEFQVGPAHKHIERRRRSVIAAIVTLGVVPLLLEIASSIFGR